MIKKIKIFLQWLFITLRIVKSTGARYTNGEYICLGFNKKNPLMYLMLILASVFFGIIGFCSAVYELWHEVLND